MLHSAEWLARARSGGASLDLAFRTKSLCRTNVSGTIYVDGQDDYSYKLGKADAGSDCKKMLMCWFSYVKMPFSLKRVFCLVVMSEIACCRLSLCLLVSCSFDSLSSRWWLRSAFCVCSVRHKSCRALDTVAALLASVLAARISNLHCSRTIETSGNLLLASSILSSAGHQGNSTSNGKQVLLP